MAGILLAQNSSRIIGVVINDHEKYEGHTLEDPFISASLNCLAAEIDRQDRFMMVKKTKDPEEIISFASMWNMDGLIVIGFCDIYAIICISRWSYMTDTAAIQSVFAI